MTTSSVKTSQPQTKQAQQLPCGSVRTCLPYGGELARHRIITADGFDYIVATVSGEQPGHPFTTGAYPVSRGYLVMFRQPLREVRSSNAEDARRQHEQLVRVLSEAGVGVVRAQRSLAARRRAEQREAAQQKLAPDPVAVAIAATRDL